MASSVVDNEKLVATATSNAPEIKPEPVDETIVNATVDRAPKTPKTPVKRKKGDGVASPGTPSKKAKGNGTGNTPGKQRDKVLKIAESADELSAHDQMLLSWKDEGKSWAVIKTEWERLTGNKPGGSTLPNRYARLKANLACVTPVDIPHMMSAETEAVEQIEAEIKELWAKKWARVGKIMEGKGAASYPAATIEKQFKKVKSAPVTTGADSPQQPADDEMADDA
ncbi:hypothetical protein EJ08DRAFT_681861 [Tothia fuscella]|uniref:Myb-like domain-containing protein n=1 Tax=Tothia fuscella TaxID=1048955 RepID=A0A9P4NJK8_9PEZI|nr:hypothetical protein EJ08DRAFT_681861 [Tothia fuscella]